MEQDYRRVYYTNQELRKENQELKNTLAKANRTLHTVVLITAVLSFSLGMLTKTMYDKPHASLHQVTVKELPLPPLK